MNDGEAIELLRSGHWEGAQALVERYQTDVYNVALRLLGNSADAQDASQDAFIAAVQRIDQFRPGESFGAWLSGIARHRSLDALRRRRRATAATAATRHLAGSPVDVEETAARHLADLRVREALDRLPNRDRTLLVLRYWEDMAIADIARAMGLTVGATKVALLRARRSVMETLGGQIDEL